MLTELPGTEDPRRANACCSWYGGRVCLGEQAVQESQVVLLTLRAGGLSCRQGREPLQQHSEASLWTPHESQLKGHLPVLTNSTWACQAQF